MSVTFWCPDAPRKRVPCPYCRAEGKRCDAYCNGYDEVSEAPEVNLSNSHAARQLVMLGRDLDLIGVIPASELPAVIRTAIRALATNAAEAHVEPPLIETGGEGARIFYGGMDPDRLTSAQQRLMQLFAWAADHGYPVHYG